MAYLIDESYFQRNYLVPNADELNSGAYAELQQYIDSKARLCLKDALGRALFNDLDSNITNGVLDGSAPTKWKNLVNGVEYTKNGETLQWEGLLRQEGAFKESLLTPFVYYHWLYDNQSKLSGVGEVVMEAKNSFTVGSSQRLVNTWNEFVNQYQGEYFEYKTNTYYRGNVKVIDYLSGYNYNDDEYVSLIRFLLDNDTDYPKPNIKRYKFKNQLGL